MKMLHREIAVTFSVNLVHALERAPARRYLVNPAIAQAPSIPTSSWRTKSRRKFRPDMPDNSSASSQTLPQKRDTNTS
jgi:hypothetical protein